MSNSSSSRRRKRRRKIRTKRDRIMPSTDTHVMSHMQRLAVAVVHCSHLLEVILADVYILQERTVDHTHQFREMVLS